jgi:hypothetical protein
MRDSFLLCSVRNAVAALVLLLSSPASTVRAQELRTHATPFSVWLDFHALVTPKPPKVALPIWLESLQTDVTETDAGLPVKTTFRLRFRPLGDLNRDLLLRLFFDDAPGAAPMITGWAETGEQLFERGPLGAGLDLPTSEALVLPMTGVSYIDVTAGGDGSKLRGVFLTSLRKGESFHSLDFAASPPLADSFDNLPSAAPEPNDSFLYGRVKAVIDSGIVKLAPRGTTTAAWEFDLEGPPFLAVLSFEILNADPLSPVEVIVNEKPLGVAAARLPDLADPGYRGVLRPLDRGVRFRYAGWLQSQKSLPGSALRAGLNKIVLRLPVDSGPVAVRGLGLQLKNEWQAP